MSLTKTDKITVCQKYDSLLSSLIPLEKLMTPPYYPNLINFDDYKTGAESEHGMHINIMATEIAKDTNIRNVPQIVEYIKKPDFEPKLNVRTRAIEPYTTIEDAVLYRSVYETTLINIGPRKLLNNKKQPIYITRFKLIKLSKEIYYLEEITLETTKDVYDYISTVVLSYASPEILHDEFNKLVWLEIQKRECYIKETKNASNFIGINKINAYISDFYNTNHQSIHWKEQGKISLDNRKRMPETGELTTLTATLRKKL